MQLLISNELEDAAVGEDLCSLIEDALQEVLALEEVRSGRVPVHRTGAEVGIKEGIGEADANKNLTSHPSRLTSQMEVSLVLVDDVRMESLNRQYRGIAGTTDVLSFSMLDEDGEEGTLFPPGQVAPAPEVEALLGDIVISVPRARSQAAAYGNSFQQEMVFLAVHGMLHLLGYDDETEPGAARMMERTRQVMDRLGLGAGGDV